MDLYVRFMLAWRNEKATTANSLTDYSAADGITEVGLGAGLDGGMSAWTRLGPPPAPTPDP